MFIRSVCLIILFCLFLYPVHMPAHDAQLEKLLDICLKIPTATGNENQMADTIMQMLGSGTAITKNSLGSLFYSLGQGEKHIVVLTGMDEVGYIVSGIESSGYLTLDRVVPAPHVLFDSWQHGHSMQVYTENGPVAGVMALPSTHILGREQRGDLLQLFSLENAYLDIGAATREQCVLRGINLLDPVLPQKKLIRLAQNKLAGYALGTKANTAVLIRLAMNTDLSTYSCRLSFVWLAQTKFLVRRSRPQAAIGAVQVSRNLQSSEFLIVDIYPCDRSLKNAIVPGQGPVLIDPQGDKNILYRKIINAAEREQISVQRIGEFSTPVLNAFKQGKTPAAGIFLPVMFYGTPSEIIDIKDVERMIQLLGALLAEGVSL